MPTDNYNNLFKKPLIKIVLLIFYFFSTNLLAGYAAVWFKFPSLWGNNEIFLDYAMPFGLTWALSHWPSLIIFSIPLLLIPNWDLKLIQRYRIICITVFLLLIYGIIEKVPFALFPAIDSLIALIISFVMRPPGFKESPKSAIGLSVFSLIFLLICCYYIFDKWQHRIPTIKESRLMNGLYELTQIDVNKNNKEMTFNIFLNKFISEDKVCNITSKMTEDLFESYPYDKNYKKIAKIKFNPDNKNNYSAYTLGQIEQYKENNKLNIACYLKYK